MREILFRGFHECEDGTHKAFYNGKWHTGEWVYGYYGRKGVDEKTYKHYICKPVFNPNGITYNGKFYFEDIDVAPETVCQYTGLNDKNENKIFEGDIFKFKDGYAKGVVDGYAKGVVKFGQCKSSFNHEPKNDCSVNSNDKKE